MRLMIYAPFEHPLTPLLLTDGVLLPSAASIANDEDGDPELADIFADVRACLVH